MTTQLKKLYSSVILKLSIITLITVLFLSVFTLNNSSQLAKAEDGNTQAVDDAIKDAQDELDAILKQKEEVEGLIQQESLNQVQLKSEADYVKSAIAEKEYQVRNAELELLKIEAEAKVLTAKRDEAEKQLEMVRSQKIAVEEELLNSTNYLYKGTFKTPSLLDGQSSFQDTIVENEKQKALVDLIKADMDEIARLEKEVETKKNEVIKKEKEIADKQTEKIVESDNLVRQKQGLEWQKENKENLTKESLSKQEELERKNEELKQKQLALQAQLDSLLQQKVNAPPPVNGKRVEAGQVIGVQGRTGYVCGYVADTSGISQDQLNNSANYCGPPLYFLSDMNAYPTLGSHLHFSYYVADGYAVDPAGYYGEFKSMPMDNAPGIVTQGFHGGHLATDYAAAHGAPIYAIKPGVIQYSCDYMIPTNPGFGAVVYHDDGTSSLYWHLQGSC